MSLTSSSSRLSSGFFSPSKAVIKSLYSLLSHHISILISSLNRAELAFFRLSKGLSCQPSSSASRSKASLPRTSVAVVITASASRIEATCRLNLLAPPTCPERALIAYLPASSTTTTAGSVRLSSSQGDTVLTTMPRAMMQIIPSYSAISSPIFSPRNPR